MLKPIKDFPKYFISPVGDVFSTKWGKFKKLKQTTHRQGYKVVSLGSPRKTLRVHRLVAEAYLLNPENKPEVNHKNGDKSDPHVRNLEWTTKSENIKHGYDNGLYPDKSGEGNGRAILDETKVREIKRMLRTEKSCTKVGRKFGVSDAVIRHIKNGTTWSHVQGGL